MKRLGLAILALTLVCLLALPAYSVSTTVGRCAATAQRLLASADPLDRNPPTRVVAAISARIGTGRLSDVLATVLLDRFSCSGDKWDSADWLLNKPALAWRLERTFDRHSLIALYASTADMGKGAIGLNRGARRFYGKEIATLDDKAVDCLMRYAIGAPTDVRYIWPRPISDHEVSCPHDSELPPPRIVN